MLRNVSVLPPRIHAVASVQNFPEPIAAGIMSAPSKRKTSEAFSRSAKPLMTGSLMAVVSKSLRVDSDVSPAATSAAWYSAELVRRQRSDFLWG